MFCENCPKHVLTTYFQGIDMTFPYDESIFDCYKERETCKNRDLQGEVIIRRILRFYIFNPSNMPFKKTDIFTL